jgi:hypothetical protein
VLPFLLIAAVVGLMEWDSRRAESRFGLLPDPFSFVLGLVTVLLSICGFAAWLAVRRGLEDAAIVTPILAFGQLVLLSGGWLALQLYSRQHARYHFFLALIVVLGIPLYAYAFGRAQAYIDWEVGEREDRFTTIRLHTREGLGDGWSRTEGGDWVSEFFLIKRVGGSYLVVREDSDDILNVSDGAVIAIEYLVEPRQPFNLP